MKIRSLTYFINPETRRDEKIIQASNHANHLRDTLATVGIEVQTIRLATTPFSTWLDIAHPLKAMVQLQELEDEAREDGFDYVSIGPALPGNISSYQIIPNILSSTNLFASALITTPENALDTRTVRACASIIHRCGEASPDGFTNLRFAALGNVPAGSPFFPSAYAHPERLGYGIAIEGADLALEAFSNATDIACAQSLLVKRINEEATIILEACKSISSDDQKLVGLDFTLAPFPDDRASIGKALEKLGLPALGKAGSVTASAILMSAMQQATYPRTGFNGLMMPVLEDSFLAKRAAEGSLGVQDLLLYSTVCGTGLDTIPLPGDTSEEQIYAILLDVGALSLRLNKPLTARLMPIPGKSVGGATEFEFSYFANSRVMDPDAGALSGLLAVDGIIPIQTRF
jgi:uncharacterized protein